MTFIAAHRRVFYPQAIRKCKNGCGGVALSGAARQGLCMDCIKAKMKAKYGGKPKWT